ncbi:unnamed protein product, partial [Staurois parvus]
YKRPPRTLLVCAPWERAQHRDPVPAVSPGHIVSKMSLVTSLLTTCEICE